MRYLLDIIKNHILSEAEDGGSLVRVVLPGYPSDLLKQLGTFLKESFSRNPQRKITLNYGIAYRLGEEWNKNGDALDKANFEFVKEQGWYNSSNNLTVFRNRLPDPDETLVTVLAGYEYIDDRAGLQDFFQMDQDSVWGICLKHSFIPWIHDALKDFIDVDDESSAVPSINLFLSHIYRQGIGSLLTISDFLEKTDFSQISNERDAYEKILEDLHNFGLPPLVGLRRKNDKYMANYVIKAAEFSNYGMFLLNKNRKSALKRIEKYKEEIADGTKTSPDSEIIGDFSTIEDLLDSLKKYVDEQSEQDRLELLKIDFVFIYDQILQLKIPVERKNKKPNTVKGTAPEIFLRALWLMLGEFKKELRATTIIDEKLDKITIKALQFKHDFTSGEEDEHDDARIFLNRILGGIDEYLQNHLSSLDIGNPEDPKYIDFYSDLIPDNLSYASARSAEPSYIFEIMIYLRDEEEPIKGQFAWKLPNTHPTRLMHTLYAQTYAMFAADTGLPCFTVAYLPEMFSVADEEAIMRMMDKSIASGRFHMHNLLNAPGNDFADPLRPSLQDLSVCYHNYVKDVCENGFIRAISGDKFGSLKKYYEAAMRQYLEECRNSSLGAFLFKAFLLVDEAGTANGGWMWYEYVEASIITPLHPILIEMMRQQYTYLGDCFIHYVHNGLRAMGTNRLTLKNWEKTVDLCILQWPVYGFFSDSSMRLTTSVRSYNYLHLVGQTKHEPSFINSRTLIEYETDEEDEFTDEELFRSGRSSQLIFRALLDYQRLNPQAFDGLSIGCYTSDEIQPFIAGIDAFLAETFKRGIENFSLHLTMFSENAANNDVMKWINAWRDRWQQPEQNARLQHYGNCHVSIAYRVVSRSNNAAQFISLLNGTELDIMFFNNFIDKESSRFQDIDLGADNAEDYRKFPILEKICCRRTGGAQDNQRERILTNRRFGLSALHSEVVYRLHTKVEADKLHLIINYCDFTPWRAVIDAAHQHTNWVICIDPMIDKELLIRRQDARQNIINRDIIGFGTGVGPHGENNYTVSTDKYSMVDIKDRLKDQTRRLFPHLKDGEGIQCVESLVKESVSLTGMSLVRATGSDRFVREYLAAAMVRKLIPQDEKAFSDEIVALDSFMHWFDDPDEYFRADLLRLRSRIVDGYFVVDAQVVECKLANVADNFLVHARQQLESALRQLISHFRPRRGNQPLGTGKLGEDDPEARYWWMQLHRLLASKGTVPQANYAATLAALERLSDGYFTINWKGAAVAFWRDKPGSAWDCGPQWDFEFDDKGMNLYVGEAGASFIPSFCASSSSGVIFTEDDNLISYTYKVEENRGEPVSTTQPGSQGADDLLPEKEDDEPNADTGHVEDKGSGTITDREKLPDGPPPEERPDDTPHVTAIPVKPRIPERILLGSRVSAQQKVYWEFGHPDIPNRHILVFGSSGSGKTYTIQALLCELGKSGQNSLIVDYTNGFTNNQLETTVIQKLKPLQHVVRNEPLKINPFRKQSYIIDDLELFDRATNVAERVRGVFSSVYSLGDQQKAALYEAITAGVNTFGDNFTLERLVDGLESLQAGGGPNAGPAATVLNKMRPFVEMEPFKAEDQESWEQIFNDRQHRCHIIQLAGFMKDTSRLITEFSLLDLYWYYRSKGSKDNPRVLVLDEIQNLDHKLEGPLGQILTEGRKFGISLILATQTLSNFERDERDRLFQASHKLFFKPADTEINTYARILSDATGERQEDWVAKLTALKRGECYSLGSALNERTGNLEVNKYFKVRIDAIDNRFNEGVSYAAD